MLDLIFDYLLVAAVVAVLAAIYFKKAGTTEGVWKASIRVGLSWPLLVWGWISTKFKTDDAETPPSDTTPPEDKA
jgi:hypothetical protein